MRELLHLPPFRPFRNRRRRSRRRRRRRRVTLVPLKLALGSNELADRRQISALYSYSYIHEKENLRRLARGMSNATDGCIG